MRPIVVFFCFLMALPISSYARTEWVQKPVTRTEQQPRSFVEIKYAIADHYWRHDLGTKRIGWDIVAVEATLKGTIVIHVINEAGALDRFTINQIAVERIGNQPNVRFKSVRVQSLEWVEVEVDTRFEFPLVSTSRLKQFDTDNGRNGLLVSYDYAVKEVTQLAATEELRLVSYHPARIGFKTKRWIFNFASKAGTAYSYEVKISYPKLFSNHHVLNYVKVLHQEH